MALYSMDGWSKVYFSKNKLFMKFNLDDCMGMTGDCESVGDVGTLTRSPELPKSQPSIVPPPPPMAAATME